MDFAVESRGRKLANSRCRKYQPYGASVRHCGCNRKDTNPEIAPDSTGVHGVTPFHPSPETRAACGLLRFWAHAINSQILRVVEKQRFILPPRQKLFQLTFRMLFFSLI